MIPISNNQLQFWDVKLRDLGYTPSCIRIKHPPVLLACWREVTRNKPHHFTSKAEAQDYLASLPVDLQAISAVTEFVYL